MVGVRGEGVENSYDDINVLNRGGLEGFVLL